MSSSDSSFKNLRSKDWAFTIYDLNWAITPEIEDLIEYAVFQEEKCPKTGRHHLQGTVCFKEEKRGSRVKKIMGEGHFEKCIDTEASIRYCKKSKTRVGDAVEFGTYVPKAGQGKRTDLDKIMKSVQKGDSWKQLAEEHGGAIIRYVNGLKHMKNIFREDRTWETEVHIIWGDSGTGKSKRVWDEVLFENKDPSYYEKYASGEFYDGYDGEEDIIIDDFRGGIDFTHMLKLCDRYPFKVNVKHGMCSMLCRRVFITSNLHPRDWWGPSNYLIFERRIKTLINLKKINCQQVGGNTLLPPESAPTPAPKENPISIEEEKKTFSECSSTCEEESCSSEISESDEKSN